MSRINVLWVIDHVCYDGSLHGGGRLYWNVLRRFDPDRFRVVPCLLRASDTIRQVFRQSPVPVRILDKAKFDPTTLWTLLRLLKAEDIHVMHLHCYGASTFGRLAGWLAGVPSIIHDYDTEIYFPYPWYLGLADRLLAPVTRLAIAPSPMVRDFLITRRRVQRGRIETMLHAIPAERFARVPPEEVCRTKEHLGILQQARIVGTVTKLGPQRGNEYLLKAAVEVVRAVPNALFLVVYKPTYFHRLPNQRYVQVSSKDTAGMVAGLRDLASKLGIAGHVRFVEAHENVDTLVAACDLMVAPFLSERFSSVNLLEAMAMRKPVIATDLGEQREFIEDRVNGYLVPAGDVEALARTIVKVLTQEEEGRRMGERARVTAEGFSADAYVQRLQSLYGELAMNGKTSG